MSYPDPTAILTAAADGAVFVDGMIDYDGGPKYLKLTAGTWSLDGADGVLLRSRRTLALLAGGTMAAEEGEYEHAIDTERGRFQLAVEDGVAALTGP